MCHLQLSLDVAVTDGLHDVDMLPGILIRETVLKQDIVIHQKYYFFASKAEYVTTVQKNSMLMF